ncbi:MAG: MlaE family ABC transporter permease [Gemmatimonas sp.]|jgi:phospholipid/cholesterol/gamma-HCH transport system permease protein|uniref:MlaE family ABC transporter permease n=1 Tax=Gemmatimonas sp. TaxID=1962908 RepID=UPI00391F8689|nr:ABC transporter permease [Gemmatimonadota bacterium]
MSEPTTTSPPGIAQVSAIGRRARRAIEPVGTGARFVADVARAMRATGEWVPEFSTHARILGVESLPIGIFIALFTGIVLALLASYSVGDLVPPYFVGTLVQKTVTLELAPVLTGLALAGRVGANIAAELGTMRVTEQIDALETLTFDPMSHLVVPRVLASALMFPVVVGVAMLVGLLSGWLASLALLDISTPQFLKGVRMFFQAFDVRYGLVKSASFGAAVALIGCRAGLTTMGGAQGVGRSATRAVVISAVMILVLDAFWALVWLTNRTIR